MHVHHLRLEALEQGPELAHRAAAPQDTRARLQPARQPAQALGQMQRVARQYLDLQALRTLQFDRGLGHVVGPTTAPMLVIGVQYPHRAGASEEPGRVSLAKPNNGGRFGKRQAQRANPCAMLKR